MATAVQTRQSQAGSREIRRWRLGANLLIWALLGIVFHWAAPALNGLKLWTIPLGYWASAQIVPLLIALLLAAAAWRDNANGIGASASHAAGWVPAVALLGITGAIASQGHDGLAYLLAFVAAAFVFARVFAPAMAAVPDPGQQTSPLSAYLSTRYASATLATAASAVVAMSAAMFLAAEFGVGLTALKAAGLAPYAWAAIALATGAGIAAHLTQAGGRRWLAGGLIILVALVLLAALGLLEGQDGPGVLVSAPTIANIAGLEQTLLEKRLADPAVFKPYSVPFLRTDGWNFAALVAVVSLGLAILAWTGKNSRKATRSPAGPAALAVTVLALLPPVAAAAKETILTMVANGLKAASLPAWMAAYLDAGLLQVCGQQSSDTGALVKACGKGTGGLLRWQDLNLDPDAYLPAALDHALSAPVLAKAALATVICLALAWSVSRLLTVASIPSKAPAARITGGLVIAAAALVALAAPVAPLTLVNWSASFAAASLAPAVLLAIFVRRPSVPVALLALVLGGGTAVILILGARFAPLEMFALSGQPSNLLPAVARKLAGLQEAMAGAEGPARDALRDQAARIARDALSWGGIKPPAAGIFGVALGLAVVVAGQLIASISRRRD